MSFYAELKRRNVFRVAAAYVVVAWLLIQVAETIFPLFGFDETPARIVVITLSILFIPAMVLAWVFELTPEGLKRDNEVDRAQSLTMRTGKRLDHIIMVILALALGYFAFDEFVLDPARDAVSTRTSATSIHSLAVLPFVNMSSDQEQEYFSDGLSEELLNLLAKIPELRVAARTSSFSYKGKDINATQVGEELDVAYVLEGSVRKSGNQIRITAQLIRTDNGFHVWSETYNRTLSDIFATQDEIAAALVKALEVSIVNSIPTQQETDPEAYALYLQGTYHNFRRDEDSVRKALTVLKQAVAIDPNYAPIWIQLNLAYSQSGNNGTLLREEGTRLAREAVNKALEIDDNLATAWAARAYFLRTNDRDWAGAQAAIDRSLELDPHGGIGVAAALARTLGQFSKAITLLENNLIRDPHGIGNLISLSNTYVKVGRNDDALEILDRITALNPKYPGITRGNSRAFLLKGDPNSALIELDKNPSPFDRVQRARIYFTLGDEAKSQALIKELLVEADKFPTSMSFLYTWRGENDAAFEWLEKAYQQGDGFFSFLGNEWARGLEDDPRYPIFLEKIGLLEAWRAMPPEHGGPPKP